MSEARHPDQQIPGEQNDGLAASKGAAVPYRPAGSSASPLPTRDKRPSGSAIIRPTMTPWQRPSPSLRLRPSACGESLTQSRHGRW
jgi:hypothetical protein